MLLAFSCRVSARTDEKLAAQHRGFEAHGRTLIATADLLLLPSNPPTIAPQSSVSSCALSKPSSIAFDRYTFDLSASDDIRSTDNALIAIAHIPWPSDCTSITLTLALP